MAAHIVLSGVGLLLCFAGFVVVLDFRAGQTSSLTEGGKRKLTGLWVSTILCLASLGILVSVRHHWTWTVDLVPILAGLALSVAGLVVVYDLVPDGTAVPAAQAIKQSSRRFLLVLFLAAASCFLYSLLQLPYQGAVVSPETIRLTLLILFGIAAFGSLSYFLVKEKPDALANDSDPMPVTTRRVLAFYLVLLGSALMFLLWRIASINFPDSGVSIESVVQSASPAAAIPAAAPAATPTSAPAATPTSTPAATPTSTPSSTPGATAPVLLKLISQTGAGVTPSLYLTAFGENFTGESKLRFNQQPQPTIFIEPNRIQTPLDQAVVNSLDTVIVDVTTNKQVSGAIVIKIRRNNVCDELLGWCLTRELQLFLLALLAGALGSFVHVLKSFGDFVGNRTLTASWFWWYMTRPLLGAALAAIFYAVLRGGFMTGTPADAKAVNQFGVIAIGALAGMFADRASEKLADIFDTLFKGADNRSGKLAAPIIDRFDPPTIAHGSAARDMKIVGDRLGSVTQVKFDNVVHPQGAPGTNEITVPLTAAELVSLRTIKVSVVGPNGESATKDLQIT